MGSVLLAVGTRKGLFLGKRELGKSGPGGRGGGGGGEWEFAEPYLPDQEVYSVAIDTRRATPRVLVGSASPLWGPSVSRSDDLGASWQQPEQPAVRFPEDTGASVERVWQLHPAGPAAPDVVYAGTEPAALFRSGDGGETFEFVRSLWEHPTRGRWAPGGGGEALHTVVTDPRDAEAVTVAVSAAGVFRTLDGGASWAPSNSGVRAEFLPERFPEFGQCVHKIAQDPADPDRLYLQNHGGVYRSDDAGAEWTDIAAGLPSDFGFPIAAHPHRAGVAYIFPLDGEAGRVPVGRRCRVYRTEDAGASWQPLDAGLPTADHFGAVLRDALCVDDADPAGVYFGTRNGEVYASADEGESWSNVLSHLPDVLCVRAAVVG